MMSESEKLVDDIDINDVRHFAELPDDTIITVEENGEWVETTVGELKAEEQESTIRPATVGRRWGGNESTPFLRQ